MNFLNFTLYVLAAVGMSHILADASVIAPFKLWLSGKNNWFGKKLLEMLNCYQCNGFWSGFAVAVLGWLGLTWVLWAFAISLVSPLFGFAKLYLAMITSGDEHYETPEEK